MTWNDVFKVVITALASIGGASVVIVAVVKFCSDLLAESITKKYQLKLDKELAKFKSFNDQVKYITQRQFDLEINAYERIFECLFKFSVYTRELYPIFEWYIQDEIKRNELYNNRLENFNDAFNLFSETLEINSPFIPKDIYESFVRIRSSAHKIAGNYKEYQKDGNAKKDGKYDEENKFQEMVDEIKDKVRDYLSSLRVYS